MDTPPTDLHVRRNMLMDQLLRTNAAINQAAPSRPRTPSKPISSTEVIEKPDAEHDIETDRASAFHTINGVHIDLYDYLSIPVTSMDTPTLKKMQYVHTWVAAKDGSYMDGLRKLNQIDIQLGSADEGRTKLSKLYNWLRLSKDI